jgi:hypothetical protein
LGTYVAASGASNGSTPVYFTSSSWTGTVTGLSVNTSYQFSVIARNNDGVNSATSSLSTAVYTRANIPLAPTLSNPTASTFQITINTNGNPANTTYSLYNDNVARYITSGGLSSSVTPVYFTSSSWNGTATGLTSNTDYIIYAYARNGDGVLTGNSNFNDKFTLANTAGVPTISNPTTSTLTLAIDTSSNPSNTTYAIFNNTLSTYVAANGSSNGATPVYFTSSSWTGIVSGLSVNTSYQFSVIARNGNNLNSATSTLSTAKYTLANSALAPTVSSPTTSTLPLVNHQTLQ